MASLASPAASRSSSRSSSARTVHASPAERPTRSPTLPRRSGTPAAGSRRGRARPRPPPRVGPAEAGEDAQQRRLAAPLGPTRPARSPSSSTKETASNSGARVRSVALSMGPPGVGAGGLAPGGRRGRRVPGRARSEARHASPAAARPGRRRRMARAADRFSFRCGGRSTSLRCSVPRPHGLLLGCAADADPAGQVCASTRAVPACGTTR